MALLHYFNPGHEAAIATRSPFYTHPKSTQKMIADLATLPMWYANPEDYVFVDENSTPRYLSNMPAACQPFPKIITTKELAQSNKTPTFELTPWGKSLHVNYLFEEINRTHGSSIQIAPWDNRLYDLTGRRAAADCLEKIRDLMPGEPLPDAPFFCTDVAEVEIFRRSFGNVPAIVKTPYSSSGKGLLWLETKSLTDKDRQWIEGALSRQRYVSIERALKKEFDFSTQFYSNGEGEISYIGRCYMGTNKRGAYNYNTSDSDESLLKCFARFYINKQIIMKYTEILVEALKSIYTPYKGYFGVDMMVYADASGAYRIHPCVEVNLRHTFGLIMLRIRERLLHPLSIATLRMSYDSVAKNALLEHKRLTQASPLKIVDGQIRSGYISLCPVTGDTKYRAVLFVS